MRTTFSIHNQTEDEVHVRTHMTNLGDAWTPGTNDYALTVILDHDTEFTIFGNYATLTRVVTAMRKALLDQHDTPEIASGKEVEELTA